MFIKTVFFSFSQGYSALAGCQVQDLRTRSPSTAVLGYSGPAAKVHAVSRGVRWCYLSK